MPAGSASPAPLRRASASGCPGRTRQRSRTPQRLRRYVSRKKPRSSPCTTGFRSAGPDSFVGRHSIVGATGTAADSETECAQCRSRVAPARGVDDPADQDGEEHEDTNPMISGQYMAANTTRRRATRPARWRTGTPMQPGAGGPDETRTAAESEAADHRDGWGDTSRTGPRQTPRTGGSAGRSSPATHLRRSRAYLRHARPPKPKLDLVGEHQSGLLPPRATTEFRKSQEVHTWVNTCKQRDISPPARDLRNFRSFLARWRPASHPGRDPAMNILVTGITGFVGSRLAPRLERDGHSVRGFSRRPPARATDDPDPHRDAVSGEGLAEALRDIDVAYFLHPLDGARRRHRPPTGRATPRSASGSARAAENFARAAKEAGVSRVIYLGGLVPAGDRRRPISRAASRSRRSSCRRRPARWRSAPRS